MDKLINRSSENYYDKINEIVETINGGDTPTNLHVYSTEEKKVGKWINGLDIYEKVILDLNINMTSNQWVEFDTGIPIETLIDLKLMHKFTDESRSYCMITPSVYDNMVNTTKIEFKYYEQNRTLKGMIIQYTKVPEGE